MFVWIKKSGIIVYKAADNLVENDGIEFAGYLTFLSLLALFPFLVLIVAAAGFIGQGEAGTRFIELVISNLPHEATAAIEPRIQEIVSGPPQALLTISILGAIWTSSSAVEGMRAVLNRAYQVSNPPTYIWRRFMSILQLILFTLIIIIIMSLLVLSPLLFDALEQFFGAALQENFSALWQKYFLLLGGFLLFLVIANLYFFLPNIKQNLVAVAPGALLVVVLWVTAANLFTLYITNVDQVSIIYGSLGGFIATMLFFFLMNVIFIYGAEFNFLVSEALGRHVEEKEHSQQENEIELSETRHSGRQKKR